MYGSSVYDSIAGPRSTRDNRSKRQPAVRHVKCNECYILWWHNYVDLSNERYLLYVDLSDVWRKVVITRNTISWRRGRAVGSHAGDRGSIPGRDTFKSIKQVGSASLSLSATGVSVTRPRR